MQAAVAAGLLLCQAQHMLHSRKGAFSPSAAYSLKSLVIACGVHYPGRANALTCSLWVYKCAKCCNENEVLLWMYFAIHSKGNIFSQVFGRNKVNNLAHCALFVPYLLILFYLYYYIIIFLVDFSAIEALHILGNSQRERGSDLWLPWMCKKLQQNPHLHKHRSQPILRHKEKEAPLVQMPL